MGLDALNAAQRAILNRGRISRLEDLLLTPSDQVARRCRISPLEAKTIIETAVKDDLSEITTLDAFSHEADTCTTGDEYLDRTLGGGVRTGMLWEVAGESGAGKTQLALHLSLMMQLPERLGGLSGSTCYLTTSAKLPTARLVELIDSHPALSDSLCGLEDIHTMSCPTIPMLLHILRVTLPPFIAQQQESHSRPVKLLVIDALGELFHTNNKTTTQTLVERSRDVAEVSGLLHILASEHNIAVLVLNEVVDTFDHGYLESDDDHISYSEQARFFSRANTIPGENRKEASLGLVWANQVNVRIQLSRTGRRRHLDDLWSTKRPRIHESRKAAPREGDDSDTTTLIRRLSVIFSCVATPASVDYVVEPAGLFGIPEEGNPIAAPTVQPAGLAAVECPLSTQIPPLDRGLEGDEDEPLTSDWGLEPDEDPTSESSGIVS